MGKQGNRVWVYLGVALMSALASGCAGTIKNMRAVPLGAEVTAPAPGKALVVFMRPSTVGFAVQSSVFEMQGERPALAGIVAAKKKLSYQVQPGSHLFMVVGESADFMSADLQANRTYYALVTPRMGWWKARFSLRAVSAEELGNGDLEEWLADCEWVEKSPESDHWASSNMPSILEKYGEDYVEWMGKDRADRPNLRPEDGR